MGLGTDEMQRLKTNVSVSKTSSFPLVPFSCSKVSGYLVLSSLVLNGIRKEKQSKKKKQTKRNDPPHPHPNETIGGRATIGDDQSAGSLCFRTWCCGRSVGSPASFRRRNTRGIDRLATLGTPVTPAPGCGRPPPTAETAAKKKNKWENKKKTHQIWFRKIINELELRKS